MFDEARADLLADAGEERQHAGREAGVEEDLDEPQRDPRRLLRRLEHHRVAGDERGGDHASRDREREVPRRDHDADAARLVEVRVPLAGRLEHWCAFAHAHRLAPVVLAEVDRFAHVRVGLRERLAGFEHAQAGELVTAAAHDVGGAEQHGRAVVP